MSRLTIADKVRMEWADIAATSSSLLLVDTSDQSSGRSLLSMPSELVDLALSDSSLNARDHLALSGTCRDLRRAYDEATWKAIFEATGPGRPSSSAGLHSRFTSHLFLDFAGLSSRRSVEAQPSRLLRTIYSRGICGRDHAVDVDEKLFGEPRPGSWRERVGSLVNGCWVDRRTLTVNNIKVPLAILGLTRDSASLPTDDPHLPKVWRLSTLESLCLKAFNGPDGYARYVDACRRRGDKLKASGEKRELMQWEKVRREAMRVRTS